MGVLTLPTVWSLSSASTRYGNPIVGVEIPAPPSNEALLLTRRQSLLGLTGSVWAAEQQTPGRWADLRIGFVSRCCLTQEAAGVVNVRLTAIGRTA